ncbi:MAG TPA: rhamnan synthesis F family protein [Burkholderiales bacterium]|nr:rhamnan synthesis F family protein [Burkholderiales bacterium]
MKTVTIFAHYDPQGKIENFVIYYLEKLKAVSNQIIFVSTSMLNDIEQQKIKHLVDKIITRENIGYDFHSYKAGIDSIDGLTAYDQLILCNDSCYGPLFSLKDIFVKMNRQEINFWGITSSNLLQFHLQSYFLVFNKPVLQSNCFINFWKNLPIYQNRKDIIHNYEIALTQVLISNNHYAASYIPINFKVSSFWLIKRYFKLLIKRYVLHSTNYSTLGNILKFRKISTLDKTIILWDYLVEQYKMPFIKRKIIKSDIAKCSEVIELLKNNQINYPESLLREEND